MSYNISFLPDPYRGMASSIGARRTRQGGIFFVLSTETREDPKLRNRKAYPNAPAGGGGA